jgi:uncharacterized OB-fold protein
MDEATIYSFSEIYVATGEFEDRAPYCCAILERADGSRFAAQVDGFTEDNPVAVGKKVKLSGRAEGAWTL